MSNRSFSVGVATLGCKVNQYESEAIAEEFSRRGALLLSPMEICDVYVINTCTVTEESDRKVRQTVRRLIRRNPHARILVTGCMAQTDPEGLAGIAGVDFICGNAEKMQIVDRAFALMASEKREEAQISVTDIQASPFEPMAITHFDRTRAYVKIQDGCESHCTYCIIPSARGKIRSKPEADVLSEVSALCRNGCREVVLTGIETASYGRDLAGCDLATLLQKVDRIEGIGRVRLGSLDPSLITPRFVDAIRSLPSLSPHFHLSLQSGSDKILARMKRKYNTEMAMRGIRLLRDAIPNVKFTTDVITGFPGESEEDFAQTVAFVKEAEFLMLHVFPYSERRGTPAAQMSDRVPMVLRRKRAEELIAIGRDIRAQILQNEVAKTPIRTVLFESAEDGKCYGHTDDFLEVAVNAPPMHGELYQVQLTHTDGNLCYGTLLTHSDPS